MIAFTIALSGLLLAVVGLTLLNPIDVSKTETEAAYWEALYYLHK